MVAASRVIIADVCLLSSTWCECGCCRICSTCDVDNAACRKPPPCYPTLRFKGPGSTHCHRPSSGRRIAGSFLVAQDPRPKTKTAYFRLQGNAPKVSQDP
ncbi:hypothetical protein C8F01DRAFT_1142856 [Mycena amicta]|nr:hypothetical protein C8F01DRAFT_1142856 [Mycena amicta]